LGFAGLVIFVPFHVVFCPGQEQVYQGTLMMMTGMDAKTFTSPLRKLVQFFQHSRDNWKAKYQEAKRLCKKLSNQVRAVEKSREHWRELAQRRQRRVQSLEQELAANKNGPSGVAGAPRGA
jgi:predicted RNase H-like nuclease (RuvC/YqgF family)